MGIVRQTVSFISGIITGVNEMNTMILSVSEIMKNYMQSNYTVTHEADSINKRIQVIDVSAKELKIASDEVVKALADLNNVSQSNSTSAEDLAIQSKKLHSMVKELNAISSHIEENLTA